MGVTGVAPAASGRTANAGRRGLKQPPALSPIPDKLLVPAVERQPDIPQRK